MAETVDARGRTCPEPVILTRKALETSDEVIVLLDDEAARENVRRLALSMGCTVDEELFGAEFHLRIQKNGSCSLAHGVMGNQGPVVVVISSNTMGRGEEVLGGVLMKSFLHTLTSTKPIPDIMILFNTGVKLAVKGSEVLDDLEALSDSGMEILACGTCLDYFDQKDELAAGQISNMYDIAQTMLTAGRIVQI